MNAVCVPVVCFVLILSYTIEAYAFKDEEVPGQLIYPSSLGYSRSARIGSQPSCKGIYGPICGDCNTLWTCVGDEAPVRQQNCEQMSPGKPLCERNACKSAVSADSQCASPLRCTSEGYFPNPTDCSQYYYCEDASLSSKVYQCPPGYSYNSVTTLCRRSSWGCQTINCTANADHYVGLPDNNIYFAYCLNNLGVSLPIMFRCPNDYLNHTFFNEETQRCEFQCPYEGRFVDYRDKTAFYECLKGDEGYDVRHQNCLQGLIFDGYRNACRKLYYWEQEQPVQNNSTTLGWVTTSQTPTPAI